jgi:hypothetical protein
MFRPVIPRAESTGNPEASGAPAVTPSPAQTPLPLEQAKDPAPKDEPPKARLDPSDPELRKLVAAAVRDAAAKAREEERAKLEEEAKLAKLDAESRAKAEAKKSADEATAAKLEADKAKAEAAFTRSLLSTGLVPQTELAESMARAAAQELVATGVPWSDAMAKIGKEHAYLFKPTSAAAPSTAAAPAQAPVDVNAARTRTTGGAQSPASTSTTTAPVDAMTMTREQWAAARKALGLMTRH